MNPQDILDYLEMFSSDIGENIAALNVGNKLILVVDTSVEGCPSASGKSVVIASTRGATRVGRASVNVNVYVR